ncbi:gametocyte-specific factor 1 homolog [Daphnia pulex]|uniref:gametocyte-specific factor 1 homolog n=1 Tax=Daphnia pulex TaxID=6669 RepID=UPI001EDCBD63|nr:gametocyte-specific factor 1 homolog [Daphnia pulex]
MNHVSCPFDPAHVVESRKLQAHLIKCKRNLPTNHDYVQCNFWHLHYVRKSELDSHHASCQHRLEKEAFKVTWESETTKFFEPKLLVNEPAENCVSNASEFLDSWDTDTGGPCFKADEMIAGAIHMTVPQGLSKSKRQEFREKELERLRLRGERKNENVGHGKGNDITFDNGQSKPLPTPRKPDEISMLRLGRIAAKFPAQIGGGGRGRGILGPAAVTGWGHLE